MLGIGSRRRDLDQPSSIDLFHTSLTTCPFDRFLKLGIFDIEGSKAESGEPSSSVISVQATSDDGGIDANGAAHGGGNGNAWPSQRRSYRRSWLRSARHEAVIRSVEFDPHAASSGGNLGGLAPLVL